MQWDNIFFFLTRTDRLPDIQPFIGFFTALCFAFTRIRFNKIYKRAIIKREFFLQKPKIGPYIQIYTAVVSFLFNTIERKIERGTLLSNTEYMIFLLNTSY